MTCTQTFVRFVGACRSLNRTRIVVRVQKGVGGCLSRFGKVAATWAGRQPSFLIATLVNV